MKKKLLSLVLAGAMVASTSVSAFAATEHVGNGEINGADNKEYTTDVTIEGSVESDEGDKKPGTLSVTVPTSAAFTVDKKGGFQSAPISIKNSGTQSVDVYAYRFVDVTPDEGNGISIIAKNRLATEKRTMVALSVSGNGGTAYLGSKVGNQNNGIYSDENLVTGAQQVKIATIAKSSSQPITLDGEAGKKNKENDGDEAKVEQAVSNNFTLTLKIKKSDTN